MLCHSKWTNLEKNRNSSLSGVVISYGGVGICQSGWGFYRVPNSGTAKYSTKNTVRNCAQMYFCARNLRPLSEHLWQNKTCTVRPFNGKQVNSNCDLGRRYCESIHHHRRRKATRSASIVQGKSGNMSKQKQRIRKTSPNEFSPWFTNRE